MRRYLLNISYLGSQFRGVQKRFNKAEPDKLDPDSIQGILEIALETLKPANKPTIHISSRTDTAVHAFQSTVHVDLESTTAYPYEENDITIRLNKYLNRRNLDLRILSVQRVSDNFSARYDAILRTYLYRLAVIKSECAVSPLLSFIPIEELRRCFYVTNPVFNVELVREAAALIVGKHDFRSFMSTGSRHHVSTVRNIVQLDITPGTPFIMQDWCNYPANTIRKPTEYDYWNITCSARSFLYRQIRRTVGVLLAVGQGKLTCADVTCLLQVPSRYTWDARAVTAPPHGLYLWKVEYRPEDLMYKESNSHTFEIKR